ncbi:hypothetical protein DPMN_058654 [Dreissena polymorpha]|uniref:Glycolipid transfer protein domain-containing protein n=1 Tax=Dreissena polymorpha TaxID=45954 RepID=A0A9D4HFP8_DREPO|nr:hypothetical protein DPMN_058654 [Dreissena polymorpha]
MDFHEVSLVSTNKHDFDLEVVLRALRMSQLGGTDVSIPHYLQAYAELCRFFKLTGRLFGFVAKDLEGKMYVIQNKLDDDHMHLNYTSVKQMAAFEINNADLSSKSKSFVGCRALLRLHWALEFIVEFMNKLKDASDHDKTSVIASEVYSKTLSRHHPWITRKLAAMAVHLLPSRIELISVMCKQDNQHVLKLLGEVVIEGKRVYDMVESILYNNHLLHIP